MGCICAKKDKPTQVKGSKSIRVCKVQPIKLPKKVFQVTTGYPVPANTDYLQSAGRLQTSVDSKTDALTQVTDAALALNTAIENHNELQVKHNLSQNEALLGAC